MKKLFSLLFVAVFMSLGAYAQSYNFTGDVLDVRTDKWEKNLNGVIKLTTDERGQYVLMVEVKPSSGRGPLPFAFWTEPGAKNGLYYGAAGKTEGNISNKEVYYIENGTERLAVMVTSLNGLPINIGMGYIVNGKGVAVLQIPYSAEAKRQIYNIIEKSKSKINYTTGNLTF